jgi:hypothetical protein
MGGGMPRINIRHAGLSTGRKMKKLNGWQRIGIGLSIVWFIGFAAFVWTSEVNRNPTQ